jgi:DNA-binding LytR/AlgR family response regulator
MNQVYRILIVEDELIIAEMIKEMLSDLSYEVVGIAKNHDQAMHFLLGIVPIDLVLLDINLNEQKDGVDLATYLNEQTDIPHIYLTSYSNATTIQRAATTDPAGYLLKPFSQEDLFSTIELMRARNHVNNSKLVLKEGRDYIRINTKEVIYVKSDNNYIEVETENKNFILRNTIDNFLKEANDSNLVRTHRSYAVNILKLEAIRDSYVYVGKHKCPISRQYKQDFLKSMGTRL